MAPNGDPQLFHKKMKTLFLSNMSKSRRLTTTFFPTTNHDTGLLINYVQVTTNSGQSHISLTNIGPTRLHSSLILRSLIDSPRLLRITKQVFISGGVGCAGSGVARCSRLKRMERGCFVSPDDERGTSVVVVVMAGAVILWNFAGEGAPEF